MTGTMQFRDYIFPANPAVISVRGGEGTASLFCPGRGEVVQRLGGQARVVRCSGCFFGDSPGDAAARLAEFQQAVRAGEAGELFLPGMLSLRAWLREFVFEAEGDGRVIPYQMEFVECEVAP